MAAILKPFFNQDIVGTKTFSETDSGKIFFVSSEIPATAILTSTGVQPTANDTVTIDGKVYIFKASPSADGEVDIGVNTQTSIDNLIEAIILGPGSGTAYATAMTLHPSVTAVGGGSLKILVTAKRAGIAGNNIAVSEAAVTLSWATATLAGGAPTPKEDREFILTLPQTDVDGGNYEFIFRDDGVSEDGTRKYQTTWTLSSGLPIPFQVSSGTKRRDPYNSRSILDSKGTLQQIKLGGNDRPYTAGQNIRFVLWGGVWYSSPPLGSAFYGIGEI